MRHIRPFHHRGASTLFWVGWIALWLAACAPERFDQREVHYLNGLWQAEQSLTDQVPTAFSHTVPVPGLIDLVRITSK